VLLLVPNLLKKDLASTNAIEAGFALDSLANIMTPDLARDLVSDIFNLLSRYWAPNPSCGSESCSGAPTTLRWLDYTGRMWNEQGARKSIAV
jgi:hypothetical protein